MAKTGQNATVYRDNYWVLRFTIVDEDDPAEPPLDITSHRISYAVCRLSQSGAPLTDEPLLDFNSDDDPAVVVKTGPTGEVEVRLVDSVTSPLRPRDYYQELESTDPLSHKVVTATGALTVLPNAENA